MGEWRASVGRSSVPGMFWLGTAEKPELIGVSVLPCAETRLEGERVAAIVDALDRFDDPSLTASARRMRRIFNQVWAEQERAHAKHGETSMRSAGVFDHRRVSVVTEELGELCEVLNDRDHGKVGDGEALGLLRGEVLQLAAMACDWLLSIDEAEYDRVEQDLAS